MKTLLYVHPISKFIHRSGFSTRTEIEYYFDGTSSTVEAVYYSK